MLAAVYYAMLLTNWSTKTVFTTGVTIPTPFSFWIQMSAQWISMLVYLYSMTAPLCCPDRF